MEGRGGGAAVGGRKCSLLIFFSRFLIINVAATFFLCASIAPFRQTSEAVFSAIATPFRRTALGL